MTLDHLLLLLGNQWNGAHIRDTCLLLVAACAFAVAVAWLGIAAFLHRRNIRAVPVRIHVAGTRGKSTTTRMIAAGLRAGGKKVLAKTTGSAAMVIMPDGSETTWGRHAPPSIREQIRFFRRAARLRVDAVVIECMAIRPELVWASESCLVNSTMAVITNSRPDHLEEIGRKPGATAEALNWVMPMAGRLIVASEASSPTLIARATARECEVTAVDIEGLDAQTANLRLALAVCAAHGVAEAIARPAMEAAAMDPGQFFTQDIRIQDKPVRFVNAFACNDVESFAMHWRSLSGVVPSVILFNARPDRPLRSKQFLAFLSAQQPAPRLFLTGDALAPRLARRAGFAPDMVRSLRSRSPAAALKELGGELASGSMLWGVGNFHGMGAALLAELNQRPYRC